MSAMEERPDVREKPPLLDQILILLTVLLKRWKLIVVITAAGSLGVFAYLLLSVLLPPERSPLPNEYSAHAILLVDEDSGSGGIGSILASYGLSMGAPAGDGDTVSLLLTILRSREFLDRLVEEFNIIERYAITDYVKTTSREMVLKGAEHRYDAASKMLTLTYSSIDPEEAALFVNRQIELLEEWYTDFGGNQADKELRLLDRQLSNQEETISRLEEDIKAFQKEVSALSVEDIAALQSQMIGDLRTQKTQIDLQIYTAQQYSQGENETEELVNLRIQRNNIIYLIDQLEQGISGGEKIMPSIDELPDLAINYSKMKQELDIQAAVYQRLKEQYELAKLNSDREGLFTVLEQAEVPEVKDSPERSIIGVYGVVISGLIGVLIALILEYRVRCQEWLSRKIKDVQN